MQRSSVLYLEKKVELRPGSCEKIVALLNKGVNIPNPSTLDIGDEVSTENISGNDVKIYPGCRIYGKATAIAGGARIGAEGPVTIDNCQIGPMVELKGGAFSGSVFLARAAMGSGAQVREACILEEEAGGAHCVGLKQTILFPFVTLGSLINFCDCLMAGGKSRKDHSEVGSSYIHFNFTPNGDKATPSLLGDVPRGVMLNQPAIFLGGQGGMVGPLRLGFGNVAVAGTILRKDTLADCKTIIGKTYPESVADFTPRRYSNLKQILKNNIIFLANLVALEYWYRNVRRQFFSNQEYGELLYQGVLDKLALAKKERTGRLAAMVEKVPSSHERCRCRRSGEDKSPCELHDNIGDVCRLFSEEIADSKATELGDRFLNVFEKHRRESSGEYIQVIQSMPEAVSSSGTRWLERIVDDLCINAGAMLSSFALF